MAAKRKRKGPPAGHGTQAKYVAGCRCKWCKAAQREYVQEYRERKYYGKNGNECLVARCPNKAASSAGNGLCRRHDEVLKGKLPKERPEILKRLRKRAYERQARRRKRGTGKTRA